MPRTTLAAVLLVSSLALAENPLNNVKVYVGPEGLRVVTAMLKGDQCVVQIAGMQGPYDGLIFDCTVERMDLVTKHFINLGGRKKLALRTDGQGGGGLTERGNILTFSDAETKKENLDALWAKHQSQAAQLAALANFDRAGEAAELSKIVKDAAEPLNKACGTKLTFTFDWSAAPEAAFKEARRPADGCLKVIESMTEMCARYKVVRSTFAEKLSEVRCTFAEGRQAALALDGKVVSIGTNDWTVTLPGAFDQWIVEVL